MGCWHSTPDPDLGGRVAGHGQPPDAEVTITAQNLEQALTLVAKHLRRRRKEVTVVVVGGVVSTLHLNLRPSTHDVDFFSSGTPRGLENMLTAAGNSIVPRMPMLYSGWLNSQTSVFISAIRQQLANEAAAQNRVVFKRPGLTLLAAPWEYQFIAKLCRMAAGRAPSHDVVDAAGCLDQYLRRESLASVTGPQVRQFFQKYGSRQIPAAQLYQVLDRVARQYAQMHDGVDPFTDLQEP